MILEVGIDPCQALIGPAASPTSAVLARSYLELYTIAARMSNRSQQAFGVKNCLHL